MILEIPFTLAMALPGLVVCVTGLLVEALGRGRARKLRLQ